MQSQSRDSASAPSSDAVCGSSKQVVLGKSGGFQLAVGFAELEPFSRSRRRGRLGRCGWRRNAPEQSTIGQGRVFADQAKQLASALQ